MNSEISTEAVDVIISAVDKHQKNFEECAKQIKETMDKRFGASWHCVIGQNYGFIIQMLKQAYKTNKIHYPYFLVYNVLHCLLFL